MSLTAIVVIYWSLIGLCVVYSQVTLTPQNVLVEENNPATLTCTYTGTANQILFTWYKVVGDVGGTDDTELGSVLSPGCSWFRNEPISSQYNYSCSNNKQMSWTIKHVMGENAGHTWACSVETGSGTVTSNGAYVDIRVAIQAVTMTQPSSDGTIDVNENTRQQFRCETDGGRPIADINWYKVNNGAHIEITSNITPSSRRENGLDLRISTLQFYPARTDNGYRIYCSAKNGDNQTPVNSTRKPTLNVRYSPDGPPTILDVSGGKYALRENSTGTLNCTSTGGNPLAVLTWSCYTNGRLTDDGTTSTTVYKTVTWTAVRNSDRQCTCTSTHVVAGSQTVSVNVEILYPVSKPTFIINSQQINDPTVKVINGNQLNVHCQSSGKPTPAYTWIYQNTTTTTRGQELVIDNIQPSSDGLYTCRVENNPYVSGGNTVSKDSSITVQVQFAPSTPTFYYNDKSGPKITQDPFSVIVGERLQILGESSGQPEPQYKWRHGSNQQTGREFVISSIQRDTVTVIKCLATNVQEQTGSATKQTMTSTATVSMNILYPPDVPNIRFKYGIKPFIDITDHTVNVLEDANFTLDCHTSSNPPPTSYKWTGNEPGNFTEYHIGPIRRNSARTFTCEVANIMIRTYGSPSQQEGKNSANVSANVLFPPEILPMSNQSIEEGKPFTYTCPYTQGNPTETNVTWSRTGDGRQRTSAKLEILNVSRSDSMMYTCTVQNRMEPTNQEPVIVPKSGHFHLDVKYMTSIKQFYIEGHAGTTEVTVDEFASATFVCNVDSNPASDIAIQYHSQTLNETTGSLILRHKADNVSCGNIGVYTCEARNYLNTNGVATNRIVLFVQCTPQVFGVEEFEVYSAQYEATTITVSVIAYPEITTVVWKKHDGNDATEIRNGTRFSTSLEMVKSNETYIRISRLSLTFQNVTKPDFGNYTVQINNPIGSIEKLLRLTPKDKPDSPDELRATADINSIRVRWKPGFDGGSEQTFVLMYKTQHGAVWTTREILDNGDETMEYTQTGLEPDTEYELRLFAVNDVGNSSRISISIRTSAEGSGDTGKLIGGAAGGAGVGLLIIAALVGILVVRKRRMSKDKFGEDRALNGRPDANDDNTIEITENDAYVPADFAASSKSDACEYSQPTKKKAPVAAAGGDNLYAVVDKNKDKQDKPKKQQKGKEKGKDQGGAAQNDNIYANSPPVESPYEETQFDKQPTGKNVNKDGLIYADLAFNDRPNKGKKQIIIGDDDRTPYAQVDFTKRADPLPDSDQE